MKLEIPVAENAERPIDWFIPLERELARHDDPEKTRQLGQNMLMNGQLQQVAALETGDMIFGHGRWLAAKAVGLKTLAVKIYADSLTETQVKLIRAAENLQRKDLSNYQKWLLCTDLLCGNPTWKLQDLGEYLNLGASMITRLMSPSKCSEEWQQALKDEKVGISDCYAASKLPASEMAGLLAMKLSGASRDAIEQVGRRNRNGTKRQVKAHKLTCVLPSGYTVCVSGAAVSLEDAGIALAETIKEMKRARELGYTAKTFTAAMKDRSNKS